MISAIKSNVAEYRRRLQNQAKQVDYAASRAINDTLGDARTAIIKRIKLKQKSNKSWWLNKAYGINRRFANKSKLTGDIHTNIWWAKIQEEGGTKHAKAHKMTVPTNSMAKSYRKSGGTKRLLEQKSTFIAKDTIFRRVGGKKSKQVKRLGTLTNTAVISKPFLGFRAMAHRIARRNFKRNFNKRLHEALRTAR